MGTLAGRFRGEPAGKLTQRERFPAGTGEVISWPLSTSPDESRALALAEPI